MAVTLSGPVGLRHRTQNVKNNSGDQMQVVELLASIPESQGGKQSAWQVRPLAGPNGRCPSDLVEAIFDFQRFWKAKGVLHVVDGVVDPGQHALRQLNVLASASPVVAPSFVCGPDVTSQVVTTWTRIQSDFLALSFTDKIRACNNLFLPVKMPDDASIPTGDSLERLKKLAQKFADVYTFDTLPLFQGDSLWLRSPPVYDDAKKGPCATPSSSDFANPDPLAPGHEDENTCSDTVQVAGKCWLNGTVNYGTFGVMVRLCGDFAAADWRLQPVRATAMTLYSLIWAEMLIRAHKKFGRHPEAADLPIAWTEATFYGGPLAAPGVPGNRPNCACTCGCKGDVVPWDYVWEPVKPRKTAIHPMPSPP